MMPFRFSVTALAALTIAAFSTVRPVRGETYQWETFAGNTGGRGATDGPVAAAHFGYSTGLASDSTGNLYVADEGTSIIRKITPGGVASTLAGTADREGSADGSGSVALFNGCSGVAVDSSGVIYVADTNNHTIRKITGTGTVSTLAGSPGVSGSADGTGPVARFNSPVDVTVDGGGNVYVADRDNHAIRKVTGGGVVSTLAGNPASPGSANGTGSAARFRNPSGVVVDAAGSVYVSDTANPLIRKVTAAGVVTTLAGTAGVYGSTDGTGSAASFRSPRGLKLDAGGNLLVADYNNHTIRKVTPAGVVTTLAGSAGDSGFVNGSGTIARFDYPTSVALDSAGNIYVADWANFAIRKMTPAGAVTTLSGGPKLAGSTDGTGTDARFNQTGGCAMDAAGNLYVADSINCTIRRITPQGVVTTLAGSPGTQGSVNGTGSAARFYRPAAVAVDNTGNVFVADTDNHTIRKITPAGVVTTFAGLAGDGRSINGTGTTARFNWPVGIAVAPNGIIYVTEAGEAIRRITPAGVVTTFAGNLGESGSADGTGSAARFYNPHHLATDAAGNIFVADTLNRTIRRITPAGVVTTLAGSAQMQGHVDGTGSAARFRLPSAVAVDAAGNVYVADMGSDTVRKITPGAVVTTIGGIEGPDMIADGTGLASRFTRPAGIACTPSGIVYVADTDNYRVVRGTVIPPVATAQPVTAVEDTPKAITLTGTDIDGDPLTFAIVAPPAHGTVTGSGAVRTYSPAPDYNGPDSFTFKANDGVLDSAPVPVSITVTAVNDQPVAAAQSVITVEDMPAAVTLTGTDIDGDSLTFAVVTPPAHGTLTGAGAARTYTPSADYNGPDSFTFKANDGTLDSAPATVSITVTAVNDAPLATPQTVTGAEDSPAQITLTGTDIDGDSLTFTIVAPPAHGTLTDAGAVRTYTPAPDYNGPDSFTFKANDGALDSAPATVSLTVTAVNDAPLATPQTVTSAEDSPAEITLTGTDIDGDSLTFAIVTPPAHGTLTGTAPNLTYTPAADYNGPDSFTFKANDGALDAAPAMISLTVTPVNDAPLATGQSVTAVEDTPRAISLTGTDIDGDSLAFAIVTPPAHGTLTGTAPNLTYTPAADYNGPDFFTFKTNDGALESNPALVSIGIIAVNDAPAFTASLPDIDAGPAAPDAQYNLRPLLRDPDEGDSHAWRIAAVGNPSIFASVSVDAGRLSLSYAPYVSGASSLTIEVKDAAGEIALMTIQVTLPTLPVPEITVSEALKLNRQTGLWEHRITLKNTAQRPIGGFEVTVSGLPAGTCLYNASDCLGANPVAGYYQAVAPGESVTMVLEYFSPSRSTTLQPVITTAVALPRNPVPGAAAGLAVDRVTALPGGALLIEFTALPGHEYLVQYSPDGSGWLDSPPRIRAAGNRVQWIDRGSPRTASPPAPGGQRFYRVREATPAP